MELVVNQNFFFHSKSLKFSRKLRLGTSFTFQQAIISLQELATNDIIAGIARALRGLLNLTKEKMLELFKEGRLGDGNAVVFYKQP